MQKILLLATSILTLNGMHHQPRGKRPLTEIEKSMAHIEIQARQINNLPNITLPEQNEIIHQCMQNVQRMQLLLEEIRRQH